MLWSVVAPRTPVIKEMMPPLIVIIVVEVAAAGEATVVEEADTAVDTEEIRTRGMNLFLF